MTNYEKIKQMDVSELAKYIKDKLGNCCKCPCYEGKSTSVSCNKTKAETCEQMIEKWLIKDSLNN